MKQLRKNKFIRTTGLVLIVLIVLSTAGYVVYATRTGQNPLPPEIKQQVSFKVVYPTSSKLTAIDEASYGYKSEENVLDYTINFAGTKVVFTQQPAPESLGSSDSPYYQAIGIHPYAQFKTPLGQVVLTKFWETGTLEPVGQSAVLASKGTMVIAHGDKDLTNDQWKTLFQTLKISK